MRDSQYGFGLTYKCKLDVLHLLTIRKLLDIPDIKLYYNFDKSTDKDVNDLIFDKNKLDEAINISNVTNDMLYDCILNDDYDAKSFSGIYLIFFIEFSSLESHSAESADFYKMNITPSELASQITNGIEKIKECGIAENDIKCQYFNAEWH